MLLALGHGPSATASGWAVAGGVSLREQLTTCAPLSLAPPSSGIIILTVLFLTHMYQVPTVNQAKSPKGSNLNLTEARSWRNLNL